MFHYRPRAPARGPARRIGNGSSSMRDLSDDELVSNGGPLERTIQQDLLDLQSTFFNLLESDANSLTSGPAPLHFNYGTTFACFKAAFREQGFANIHHGCPSRCDLDSYSQLLYSACLGLLAEAFQTKEDASAIRRAAFATFALYTLYKTNPRPLPPPPSQSITKQQAFRTMSFGPIPTFENANNNSGQRNSHRTYKSPIRIDKHHMLLLQQFRDKCLEVIAQCEHSRLSSSQNITTAEETLTNHGPWSCHCGMEKDVVCIVDTLQRQSLFELCEYPGPCSVEGLAGSRLFTGGTTPGNMEEVEHLPTKIEQMMAEIEQSRYDWSVSMDLSNLQNATNLYKSSLRTIKQFEVASNRGQTHQLSLVKQTLSSVSSLQHHSELDRQVDSLEQIITNMKMEQQSIRIVTQTTKETIQDIHTDARVIENEDVITLRSGAAQNSADSLCGQGLSSGIGATVPTGMTEEQPMLDHQYKFLLPESLSREEKMSLESALKNTDWNKILRKYKNLKSTTEESSDDEHDNSLFVSPIEHINDNDTWMVNSDDLDDAEENMIIADEASDEELYDVPGTGGKALSFLLAQAKGVNAENLVGDDDHYLEESIASVYQLSFSGYSSESSNVYSRGSKKNKGFVLSSKSHLQKSAKLSKSSHLKKPCSRNDAPLKSECGDHYSVDESSVDKSIGRKALESLLMTTKTGRKTKTTAPQLPLDDAVGGSPLSYPKGKKSATKKSQMSSKYHYSKGKTLKTDDSSVITDAGRKALQALLSNITNKTTFDVDTIDDTSTYEATNESPEKLDTDGFDLTSTSTGVSINAFRTDYKRTSKISVLSTPTKLSAATSPYNTRSRARMEAAKAHPELFETRTSKVHAKKLEKIIPNAADQSKKNLNQDDSSTVTGVGGLALGALLHTVRRGDNTSSTSSEDDSCTASISFPGAGRRAKKR